LGSANHVFTDHVLIREKLSITSFHNGVVIPHALYLNARKSFISFLLLDTQDAILRNDFFLVIADPDQNYNPDLILIPFIMACGYSEACQCVNICKATSRDYS